MAAAQVVRVFNGWLEGFGFIMFGDNPLRGEGGERIPLTFDNIIYGQSFTFLNK